MTKLLTTLMADPLLLIAAIGIPLLILFFLNFAFQDVLRRWIYRNPLVSVAAKLGAIIGTLLLATSDFYAVNNIFLVLGDGVPGESVIYSLTFAAFLEGFAFLFGLALARVVDKTNYRRIDKIVNWISFFLTLVPLCAAWVLAFWLRWNQLTLELTMAQKDNLSYVFSYLPGNQIFLLFSPILTSVLALGLSWFAFPHCSLDSQERDVRYRQNRYLRFRRRYQNVLQQCQVERTALWNDIAGTDDAEDLIPDLPAYYRDRCLTRIRQKIVSDCLDKYPDLLQQYNLKFEHELFGCISQLAESGTLPHTISAITVKEILELYTEQSNEDWDSKTLRDAETDKLRRVLENAARTAQFRTAAKPHFKKW